MRILAKYELKILQREHEGAMAGIFPKSWHIRKGYEVRDITEASGKRLLTDEEIASITGEK